ncbi:MAG: GntR family transcriptional regulator [Desulfarculaceae bacterium]|nr:GntR family transcriptional regulator [Desulfarculaceae bacterium]
MAKEYEKLYEELKKRIIWLDLEPESVISVSHIAQEFKVSRTPVKEALILLQAEDWVVRQGSSFLVTPLSLDRLRELTDIRLVLEMQANVWACKRMSRQQVERLIAMKKTFKECKPGTAKQKMVEIDSQVHQEIFKAANNHQLAVLLERLLTHYLRFWLSIHREIEPQSFFCEMEEIIDAIDARDEQSVARLTKRHILISVREIIQGFWGENTFDMLGFPGLSPKP